MTSTCKPSGSVTRTLAFIGGGQMATALAGGLIKGGWVPSSITMVDPNQGQCDRLSESLGVTAGISADANLSNADVVIWAVKPQMLRGAIDGACTYVGGALHISIAAGVSSVDLRSWLGSARVIRVMPNTAALVGAGVTGMLAGPDVTPEDRVLAADIMSATGHCFWVDSDEQVDAVTAVSGSGPAYLFRFLEGFQAAAQEIGFSSDEARKLVLLTAAGAIRQAQLDVTEFSTLRERVTSKRGTTEAALAVFDERDLSGTISSAVHAAFQRASELSRELGQPVRE